MVDSGHYALFDAYWNPAEGELTNNPCPPSVEHVPEIPASGFDPGTPARDGRSPSSINIGAEPPTIIHIPRSAWVDLNEADTPYPRDQYPALWAADAAENRDTDGDGEGDGGGDRIVWALPACPPDGSPETGGLCLSFSTALLESADWDGDIKFLMDHVHQIDIDRQDPRYVLAYDVPAEGATGELTPRWNSSDVGVAEVLVPAGGYDRPVWFFTDLGTYEIQVHIDGSPAGPVAVESSVSSDVREYIVHVGAEADLGVAVEVAPALESGDFTLDPGDDVTITVTASNAGPEVAPKTEVKVTLPEGLTYSSHSAATETTYDSATGVWGIENLGITNDENDPTEDDSPTLTITAVVGSNIRGQELAVKATIAGTEETDITEIVNGVPNKVVGYDLPVADPQPGNDMATGTVTVASSSNVEPMFRIERTVRENAPENTNVGGPALLRAGDDDPLRYAIVGPDSESFRVDDSGQVSVAQGAVLNYECQTLYPLTLQVSDGKDAAGNTDNWEVDHYIGLDILVSDDPAEVDANVSVSVKASNPDPVAGEAVTLTAVFLNYSSCAPEDTQLTWLEYVDSQNGAMQQVVGRSVNQINVHRDSPGTTNYGLNGSFDQGSHQVDLVFSVTWR